MKKTFFLSLYALLMATTVQAATYTLSGTSGTVNINGVSCTISGSTVSCPSSVTIPSGDNLTAASSYNLSVSGTLDLSNNTCIGYGSGCSSQTSAINVTVTGNININNNAKVFGNLTATSGTVTLANSSNTQVLGNVVANAIAAGNNAQVFGSCMPNNAVCTQQLIAEWRMDQLTWSGTSSEVQNSVGSGYQGTAVGGAATVAGKLCQAGSFDGSTQHVDVPGLNNLLSGTASLSFWIKTTQTGNDTMWMAPGVAGIEESGGDNDVFWGWLDASGRIGVMAGNTDGAKSTSAINNGQWRHVVLTRDASSGQTKVYVDGSLQSTATSQSGLITNSFSSIGRIEDTGGTPEYFSGALDEVKIYSAVLGDAQVASIYTNEGAAKNADGSARSCPSSTTCLTDDFSSGSLDTTLWNVSGIGYTPQIVTTPTVSSSRLRLTDNVGNRAAYAQLSRWFPAANNKVVVEFDYYGWGGSGADGMAVVLSDASISPSPGGYGGSLGYANRAGSDGFGGGWLGIGLDEFGNFPNTNESRRGYPAGYTPPVGAAVAAGAAKNSVSVRGSGSGQSSGYALLANSGKLDTPVKTGVNNTDSTTKHRYRITIDHSNSVNAYVTVERDTTGAGTSYETVIPRFDVKSANSGQVAIPTNMLLSFTAGTGGSTNNHEIDNVSVCATTINPVGNANAAQGFECMDSYLAQSSYVNRQSTPSGRNPIYTKLARTAFNLRVVPLASNGSIETSYIPAGGSAKNVTVEIFDATTSPSPACDAYAPGNLVATQTATLVSGVMTTGNFTINKAYTKLMCRVTDNAVPATPVYGCSSDQFAVRPGSVTLSTIPTMATPPSASTAATIKAGAAFTLRAATSTSSSDVYSGILTQVAGNLTAQTTTQDTTQVTGGVVGTLSPASLTANATPSNNATYTEVGYLYLAAGAYRDTAYTAVDQVGDCVANSNSITLSSGKYGCNIGTLATSSLGRFIPDRFVISSASVTPRGNICAAASSFGYMGEPLWATFTLTAQNASGLPTLNYTGKFARLVLANTGTTSPNNVQLRGWDAGKAQAFVDDGTSAGRLTNNSLSGSWVAGVASGVKLWFTPSKSVSGSVVTPDGPFSVAFGLAPLDPDGVALASAALNLDADGVGGNDRQSIGTLALRFGTLRLDNAYGSERQDLSMPLLARYWNGTNWQTNTDDSCTTIPSSAVAFGRYTGTMDESQTSLVTASSVLQLANGVGKLVLSKPIAATPAKYGSFDVGINMANRAGANLGSWCGAAFNSGSGDAATGSVSFTGPAGATAMDYLGSNVCSTNYANDPAGRATFGVFKSPLIYRRENY